MFQFFTFGNKKNPINDVRVCNFPVCIRQIESYLNSSVRKSRCKQEGASPPPQEAGFKPSLLFLPVGLPARISGKTLERSVPYFSCRLSQRELCGPGIHFCTAAFRRAPTRQAGASRRCPPAWWTWRRWSRTGCPRAPRKTSAALPHRYGNTENTRICGDGRLCVKSHKRPEPTGHQASRPDASQRTSLIKFTFLFNTPG